LTVGAEKIRLKDVKSLKLGATGSADLEGGTTLQGAVKLDPLAFSVGGNAFKLDVSKALELTSEIDPQGQRLHCTIVVARSGRELGRLEQDVYVEGVRRATLEKLAAGEFVKPLPSSVPSSYLKAQSTAGDYIGGGKTFDYTGADLAVRGNNGCISITVDRWNIQFAPPRGKTLGVGNYPDAKRYPFNDSSPGLSFTGHGRGSNQVGGRFVVWELEVKGDKVVRLAVDFIHRAEGRGPPLYGMLRYNSKFQ